MTQARSERVQEAVFDDLYAAIGELAAINNIWPDPSLTRSILVATYDGTGIIGSANLAAIPGAGSADITLLQADHDSNEVRITLLKNNMGHSYISTNGDNANLASLPQALNTSEAARHLFMHLMGIGAS